MSVPRIEASGKLLKDAEFQPVSREEGFLKFTLQCRREDGLKGSMAFCYYNCEKWEKIDTRLLTGLTKGKKLDIIGRWFIDRVNTQHGMRQFHRVRVDEIKLREESR